MAKVPMPLPRSSGQHGLVFDPIRGPRGVRCTALGAAQGFDLRRLFSSTTTGTVPSPATAPGTLEWSGESGASGHPLMQADTIRVAAANFRNCLQGLWPHAERRGVSRAMFDAQVAGLTPDLRIMDLLDAQPEFTKSIWDYLDILVNDARIDNGRKLLAQHRATFDAVERAYGVDRYFVAAIWGVEFELQHRDRRPLGAALDRDACLHRPAPGLFPGGISLRARDRGARRREAGAP